MTDMSTSAKSKKVVIIYASQTGQAEAIAESINDMLIENEFTPELYSASEHNVGFQLDKMSSDVPVVFISSTTGDGEPPESSLKLWSQLKRWSHANDDTNNNSVCLSNMKYALLGLGDSNYAQFCNGPKQFHRKFEELGAKCFYGPFWADDGVGLELVVEPFKDGLYDALIGFYQAKNDKKTTLNDEQVVVDRLSELRLNVVENEELLTSELTVPQLTESHIELELLDQQCDDLTNEQDLIVNMCSPSQVHKARVIEMARMSSIDAVKACYDLKFTMDTGIDVTRPKFQYETGHSIDIVVPNNTNEVSSLLERLGISASQSSQIVRLTSTDSTKKTGSSFVKLTSSTRLTLVTFFTRCVDIRNDALKKSMLRMLAEYATNEKEKRRLLELCSREGSAQYQRVIKESKLSLLDLLNIFASCQPPLALLIQLLPLLSCRPYSLCSSPSMTDAPLQVVFNLVEFQTTQTNSTSHVTKGVATGYLSQLGIDDHFYFRERSMQNFTLPDDALNRNLLMFGPGTGVAPFVGFLRHKKYELEHSSSATSSTGLWWLFYGCRHPEKDFLFRQELTNELIDDAKQTRLSVSFSRLTEPVPSQLERFVETKENKEDEEEAKEETTKCKYVTDLIRVHRSRLADMIVKENALVYVCGDANNMSKDIMNALAECLTTSGELSLDEAKVYLLDMMKAKRYRQEIWA